LQRCKLVEKRKRGNRSNAYLVYPPDYFDADCDTQTLIESRLRRGKGGRGSKCKVMAEVISAADWAAEAPSAYGATDAAESENSETQTEENGVHLVHHEALTGTGSNIFLVNPVHPKVGELSSPSPCSEYTPGVNSVHLKNNNKNTDQKISSQEGFNRPQKRGVRDVSDPDLKEEGEPEQAGKENHKTLAADNSPPVTGKLEPVVEQPDSIMQAATDPQKVVSADFAAVKNAFRRKGYQAADRLINELLRGYELSAIIAVIDKTDFNLARNPPAVIKWMLSTGSYVVPIERKVQAPTPETRAPDPAEEAAIREMIKNTKAGLLAKTLQKAL